MSEAWLVIAIFIFAFILWVSTGGPNRPISFAGPFITPITDVGDVQEGYGEGADWGVDDSTGATNLWSTRTIFGRFEGTLDGDEDIGAEATTARTVTISGSASDPTTSSERQEHITLRARGGAVDITGWKLVSRRGDEAVIPRADDGSRIVLDSGDEAVVTTGSSSRIDRAEQDGDTWRIFLNENDELWRNSGDTIRLIDQNGRTVDTYSY